AGMVPSESSSGGKQQRGSITKTGNSLLRHVLGEAAHHARHAPRVTSKVKQRQTDLPADIVDLAWRAQVRLHTRYRHLSGRIGALKALTAIARELAGFVWAAGQALQEEEVPTAAMNCRVDNAGRGRGWQRSPRTLVHSFVVTTHVPRSVMDTS